MSGSSGMSRDDELEFRIAEWLEDGPFEAPSASVECLLEEVRRHPRRHPTLQRLRRLVEGVRRGDALEFGVARGTRPGLVAFASITVAIGLLLTFGVTPRLPPAATGEPSRSAEPNPSQSPSPEISLPLPSLPVSVTGYSVCYEREAGTMQRIGTTRVITGIVVKCSDHTSDPRMTGSGFRYYTIEIDADRTQRWYGTATMSNGGGDWNGVWTGYQAPGALVVSNVTYWLGSKGYAGLQMREWVDIGEETITLAKPGILEFVGPVDSTGTADCSATAPEATVGPVLPGEDRTLLCSVRVDDPRLSGTRTLALTIDRQPDGTGRITGTSHVENPAGAWDGQVAGSLDAGGGTFHIDEVATGSGLYAGFSFTGRLVGPLDALQLTGTVTPSR